VVEGLSLGPIVRRTLRANIVQSVRVAIQQQRLAPGTRLSDAELASQLGVSHSTVREALHQLTHEGLVVSVPHRGFFVAGFTIDDMIDLLETRGVLEGRIAEAVAPHLSPADLDELRAAALVIRYNEQGYHQAFWDADRTFHQLIVGRCPKTILVELWSSLTSRQTLFELLFHDVFEAGLVDSQAHHLAYCEGLRTGDPALARQAAEDHYERPVERLRRAKAEQMRVAFGGVATAPTNARTDERTNASQEGG
jgi:DNA-binding GntR family transcriptional regulator